MILAIYGTGGGGKETLQMVLEIEKVSHHWDKIVFIDDTKPVSKFHNCMSYPYETFIKEFSNKNTKIHMAIGEPYYKEMLIKKVKQDGYKLESIIHPHAYLADDVKLSDGVQIKMGSYIGRNAKIGVGTWVQAYAKIGENTIIGNYSQISAKVTLGNNVSIEDNVFIGMHAVVEDNSFIGKYSIISMGAAVFDSVSKEKICMGNPGRIVAENVIHRVYK